MATLAREAEWAIQRAKRLIHDNNVEIMYEEKVGGKTPQGLRTHHEHLERLLIQREDELALAIVQDELHTALVEGAL